MTYIKYDILNGGDLRTDFSNNVQFNSLNISNGIDVNSLISVNNSFISGGLIFQGNTVSYTADINFTSSIIDFNNKFIISGGKLVFPSGSFGSEMVTINGSTIFKDVSFIKTDGTEVAYIGAGNISLNITATSSFPVAAGILQVKGDVKYSAGSGAKVLKYDSQTSNLSIRKNGYGSAYGSFSIFNGLNLSNAKIEPKAQMVLMNNGTGGSTIGNIQFISPFNANVEELVNWDNTAPGILLSGVTNSTNTKHWFISTAFDGIGTVISEGGFLWFQPDTTVIRSNLLIFAFLDSSTTGITSTIGGVNTYIKAFIREQSMYGSLEFTGQHRSLPAEDSILQQENKGLIVISDGTYCETMDPKDFDTTISINESLPKVKISSKRNDKRVFGVISDKEDENSTREYSFGNWVSVYTKKPDDHRLIINSVGEGAIWVSNINGNLENGDYITSCEIPGYGMKQDATNLKNYTVAKITCDCSFDLNSDIYECYEFEFSGSTYRRAFVGCTYHCG